MSRPNGERNLGDRHLNITCPPFLIDTIPELVTQVFKQPFKRRNGTCFEMRT
jgi:hypothetical protein